MSRRNVEAIEAAVLALNKAPGATEAEAFEAGHQAGLHRVANGATAHYRYFARPELTAAWERGCAQGKLEREARRKPVK